MGKKEQKNYKTEEERLPISKRNEGTEEELSKVNDNQLWIARNEIYAR